MGGGSSDPVTGYPQYLQSTHHSWLAHNASPPTMTSSISDLMEVALTEVSPYSGKTAFDPSAALTPTADSLIEKLETDVASLRTTVGAYDPTAEFRDAVDEAVEASSLFPSVDFLSDWGTVISDTLSAIETALSASAITNMVTAFETNKKVRFLRDVGLWSAGMADLNAVHTSSFIMGLALQQVEFANSVDDFEARLKRDTYHNFMTNAVSAHVKAHVSQLIQKGGLIASTADLLPKLEATKLELRGRVAGMQHATSSLIYSSMQDFKLKDIGITVDDAQWDMEVYQFGGNVMAAIAGASPVSKPRQLSKGEEILGGMATGASLGSVGGPTGALVGAGIGGLLTWAMG